MQQVFIIKQNNPNLLLFFAGWGMDVHPFEHFRPAHHDFLICYDYRSLHFDVSLLNGYKQIDVVAWSMGVWAATQVSFPTSAVVGKRIAINGTPYPIDAERGIPPAIFSGTLEGLNETTLKKFQRRMCGTMESFKHFQSIAPQRCIKSLKEELAAIGKMYETTPKQPYHWDEAFVGTNDHIFPAENQQRAWQAEHIACRLGEEAHYDKQLFTTYLETFWTTS